MSYCKECGTELIEKECAGEGIVPYCPCCEAFRFPQYNVAVSMEVLNPDRDKVLLIKQYNKPRNILVAGYVNLGECAEAAVAREIMEEIGLNVSQIRFMKSEYFKPSNTLMINFCCIAESEDLSHMTSEVDEASWFSFADAKENIAHDSLAERFLLNFLKIENSF